MVKRVDDIRGHIIVGLEDAKEIVSTVAENLDRDSYRCLSSAETNINDAIGFLKAQEPKTVIVDDMPKNESWFGIWFGRCPNCKQMLVKKEHKHFCGYCGQEVKWGW